MVDKRQPEDLTREQLLDIVKAAREALWPADDATHTWSPDTIEDVAHALTKYDDATPDELAKARERREITERTEAFWNSASAPRCARARS